MRPAPPSRSSPGPVPRGSPERTARAGRQRRSTRVIGRGGPSLQHPLEQRLRPEPQLRCQRMFGRPFRRTPWPQYLDALTGGRGGEPRRASGRFVFLVHSGCRRRTDRPRRRSPPLLTRIVAGACANRSTPAAGVRMVSDRSARRAAVPWRSLTLMLFLVVGWLVWQHPGGQEVVRS
jgi:hypothetical protein